MRLTREEIAAIKSTVERYDRNAEIRLFGSRTNDDKRGGDIDLLILSSHLSYGDKLLIRSFLKDILGNRKIDILLTRKPDTAFSKHAYHNSIAL